MLVKKNTTVAEVGRKVMGDAPLAYVESAGGVRVAEDDLVAVGKNDVSPLPGTSTFFLHLRRPDPLIQGWPRIVH